MTVQTYVVDKQGRAIIPKDPDATLDYSADWTAWLDGISDTIDTTNATWATPTYPSGGIDILLPDAFDTPLVEVSRSSTTKIVTGFIKGGQIGKMQRATFRIYTVGGRIDDRTIYIKTMER